MKNKLFAVIGFLLVFWFVLAGCSTGSDDDGDNNNNNNSGIVGKWLGGDEGTDQFEFTATTYLFTKTEGKDVSTFSGTYTYTQSDSKLILKVTNVTLWAIFVVQPGQTIEATISWQDDDNFTVVESTLKETRDKKWRRQK
jgi:hypothetical protein